MQERSIKQSCIAQPIFTLLKHGIRRLGVGSAYTSHNITHLHEQTVQKMSQLVSEFGA